MTTLIWGKVHDIYSFWFIFSYLDLCVKSWSGGSKYSPFSHDRTNAQCKKDKNRRPCISNPRRTNIVFIIPVTNYDFRVLWWFIFLLHTVFMGLKTRSFLERRNSTEIIRNSYLFLTFPACFSIPIIFAISNSNSSNLLDMRNLQEQGKHSVTKNCPDLSLFEWIMYSSDLKKFASFRPSASNFKSFSWSLEQFFLTVGQNNFDNKIPFQEPPPSLKFHNRTDINVPT